jgi:hypothetical protein
LTVSIGKPFDISELDESGTESSSRSEQYRRMSEDLMLRVDNA